MGTDVTNKVSFQDSDDEYLPLTKCVCGKEYKAWDILLSIYCSPLHISSMPCCGRKLYFRNNIVVYEEE